MVGDRDATSPLWWNIRGGHFATRPPHRSLYHREDLILTFTFTVAAPLTNAPSYIDPIYSHLTVAVDKPFRGALALVRTRRRTARTIVMPARKRAAVEMEVEEPVQEPSTLQKLRNMWQFANLAQYISMFGEAVKIDRDFDIEVRPSCAGRRCDCAGFSMMEGGLTCV